nr:hypothetical protein Iba_chr04aCG23180 [Ipomoea batatas]
MGQPVYQPEVLEVLGVKNHGDPSPVNLGTNHDVPPALGFTVPGSCGITEIPGPDSRGRNKDRVTLILDPFEQKRSMRSWPSGRKVAEPVQTPLASYQWSGTMAMGRWRQWIKSHGPNDLLETPSATPRATAAGGLVLTGDETVALAGSTDETIAGVLDFPALSTLSATTRNTVTPTSAANETAARAAAKWRLLKFFIVEPNKKLGQRFKKQRRLIHVSRVHDVRQHAPPQAIGVHEDIDELLHLRRHGLLDGRFRLLTRPFAAPPLPPNPINKLRLSVPGTRRQRGHHEPEPALDLVDPRCERPRRAPPRHIQVPRLPEILPRFSSGVFVGIVVLEKRAEEIGEEVGMEVSEPEEWLLEAVAPIREERLSDVV